MSFCLFLGRGRLFSGMSVYMVLARLGGIASLSGRVIEEVNMFMY